MISQKCLYALAAFLAIGVMVCKGQDYDDEGYGNQGGNQGDGDSYGGDDSYSSNAPSYQQNVDSEGSSNNPSNYSPQGNSDAEGDYDGDDGAAASSSSPTVVRIRRSVDAETSPSLEASASKPKMRVKRHGKYYIGPVYTYVKTDKHANFKWGVKHKVGKKHG